MNMEVDVEVYLPLHLFDPEFLLFLGGMSRTELTRSKS